MTSCSSRDVIISPGCRLTCYDVIVPPGAGCSASAGQSQASHLVALMSLDGHVGPGEATPGQQHVSDECLYRSLAHQAHEEELLDHLGGHGAE